MRIVPLIVLAGLARAQTTPPPAEFEVASVKPAASPEGSAMAGGPGTADPGRIDYVAVPLSVVLQRAYGVRRDEISGPGWLSTDLFTIVANVPLGATKDDLKVMLQDLLAERFQMKLHHANQDMLRYVMTVMKGGLKIKESAGPSEPSQPAAPGTPQKNMSLDSDGYRIQPAGWSGISLASFEGNIHLNIVNQPLSLVAKFLTDLLGRPVVDATEATGNYDFRLVCSKDGTSQNRIAARPARSNDAGKLEPSAPTIFAALEKLGLKVEGKKIPTDTLVVDHAERLLSGN